MRVSSLRTALAAATLSMAMPGMAQTFIGLGTMSGHLASEGWGISADGTIVLGRSGVGGMTHAFSWTAAAGFIDLGTPAGAGATHIATSVSHDGSVIVGRAQHMVFRWTASGGAQIVQGLESIDQYPRVSGDGATIIANALLGHTIHAVRWTIAAGIEDLGPHTPLSHSSASHANRSGSIVVGKMIGPGGWHLMRWMPTTGMEDLGGYLNLATYGGAVSEDGSVIAGRILPTEPGEIDRLFRWTQLGGFELLPNPRDSGVALRACSGSGKTLVGVDADGAFVWRREFGAMPLAALLRSLGVDLAGWSLDDAAAISSDGRSIVGTGIGPNGQSQAYLATIPAESCDANCDSSSVPPVLNVNDFVCFQNSFAAGTSYANCDGSTLPPVLNVADFLCFLIRYAAGCP